MEDTISTFKIAEFPRTLFSSDGSLLHCVAKSKLINVLEGLLAHQEPQTPTVQPHYPDRSSRPLVIFDGVAANCSSSVNGNAIVGEKQAKKQAIL